MKALAKRQLPALAPSWLRRRGPLLRVQWLKYRKRIASSRLVFIDETWTKTNMAPLRGWAPRGQRIKAKVPHGRWQTMTFLAALRQDRITAPWLVDGPINAEAFRLYIENVLVPTLQPGGIVIMDNLGSHKGEAVRRAIRAAGARLFFLPKYSPKFKHWLRKAEKRTIDAVYEAIGPILQPSHQPSARTISPTPGMNNPNPITL